MSSTFYISPFQPPVFEDETDLKIQPEDYIFQLKNRWNTAKVAQFISSVESESDVARWDIEDNDIVLYGGLQKEQIVVSFRGNLKGVCEFVVWHRNYVSKDIPLFFFDDGLHININISDSVSENDIAILLNAT